MSHASDILVAHSYFLRLDAKQVEKMRPYSPLATLITASVLRERGHRVALFDAMLAEGEEAFEAVPVAFTAPYASSMPAPVSNTSRVSLTADFISRALTVAGERPGSFCSIRAAVPATSGAAIEVPDSV